MGEIYERRLPNFLTRNSPEAYRRPDKKVRVPGEVRHDTPKLKIAAHVSYFYNASDPEDYSINITAPMLRGVHSDKWINKVSEMVVARGGVVGDEVHTSQTTIWFTHEAVLDFLSLFHYAILEDTVPPEEHVAAIKARSTKNTVVGLGGFDFESLPQDDPAWDSAGIRKRMREFQRLSAYIADVDVSSGCASDGESAYGSFTIDRNEANDCSHPLDLCNKFAEWPPGYVAVYPDDALVETTHRWACDPGFPGDVTFPAYATKMWDDGMAKVLAGTMVVEAPKTPYSTLDFVLWADVFDDYQSGTASNAFGSHNTSARYVNGWKDLLTLHKNAQGAGHVWIEHDETVNTYGADDYPNRYNQTWFTTGGAAKTLGVLQASIVNIRERGLTTIVSDFDGVASGWFTRRGPGGAYGTWTDIQDKVLQTNALDQFVVCCARSRDVADGYLFWQPEFSRL